MPEYETINSAQHAEPLPQDKQAKPHPRKRWADLPSKRQTRRPETIRPAE